MKKKTFAEVKDILRRHEIWAEDTWNGPSLECDCGWKSDSRWDALSHLEDVLEREWNSVS